jgi:Protein of unknown function DUF86
VIGEAVKHLGPETRESDPDIPWTDIAGLRDLIAHEYFRIDIHRVLEIVERDLPTIGAGHQWPARQTSKPFDTGSDAQDGGTTSCGPFSHSVLHCHCG